MSTSRHARQAQRAVAILEDVRLQQMSSQPSRLARMIEQNGKATKLQRKIATETVTRAGSVEAMGLLHEWGSQTVARAHLIAHDHVYQTVRHLNAVMAQQMDPATSEAMAAWTKAQTQMLFRHEASLLDGVVTNIVSLVIEPLPHQEEPESFFERLKEALS